jgi:hypothetical protein
MVGSVYQKIIQMPELSSYGNVQRGTHGKLVRMLLGEDVGAEFVITKVEKSVESINGHCIGTKNRWIIDSVL